MHMWKCVVVYFSPHFMFTWVPFHVDGVCVGGRFLCDCSSVAALRVTFPVFFCLDQIQYCC